MKNESGPGGSLVHCHVLDPGRLVDVHIDREQSYALRIDPEQAIAVIEIYIAWIVGYCVYFWLSPEDLALFEEDKPAFDNWARKLAMDKGEREFGHRLLLHQGPGGNTHPPSSPCHIDDLSHWVDRITATRNTSR